MFGKRLETIQFCIIEVVSFKSSIADSAGVKNFRSMKNFNHLNLSRVTGYGKFWLSFLHPKDEKCFSTVLPRTRMSKTQKYHIKIYSLQIKLNPNWTIKSQIESSNQPTIGFYQDFY